MMRLASPLIVVALSLLAASQVRAGVPSPGNSICPVYATIGPDGSCCFDVIVRDFSSNPVAGSTVQVDFGSCAIVFCPVQPPGVTIVAGRAQAITDASGRAHFCICATFTPPCLASIYADGILLCADVPLSSDCNPTPAPSSTWGKIKILYR